MGQAVEEGGGEEEGQEEEDEVAVWEDLPGLDGSWIAGGQEPEEEDGGCEGYGEEGCESVDAELVVRGNRGVVGAGGVGGRGVAYEVEGILQIYVRSALLRRHLWCNTSVRTIFTNPIPCTFNPQSHTPNTTSRPRR